MKNILLIFIFLAISFFSYSQYSINVGPSISFGNNSFESNGGIGLGVSGEFIYNISEKNALRAYTGYERFIIYSNKYQNNNFVPIRIGYQYFILHDRIIFFTDTGIGIYFDPFNKAKGEFTFGSGAGYRWLVHNSHFIQLSAIYNYSKYYKSNYAWLTFRAGYGLNWSKKNKKQNL